MHAIRRVHWSWSLSLTAIHLFGFIVGRQTKDFLSLLVDALTSGCVEGEGEGVSDVSKLANHDVNR